MCVAVKTYDLLPARSLRNCPSVHPDYPDSKVHGANMGPTWVVSAPDGPHVGSMNLAIRVPIAWWRLDRDKYSALYYWPLRWEPTGWFTPPKHLVRYGAVDYSLLLSEQLFEETVELTMFGHSADLMGRHRYCYSYTWTNAIILHCHSSWPAICSHHYS